MIMWVIAVSWSVLVAFRWQLSLVSSECLTEWEIHEGCVAHMLGLSPRMTGTGGGWLGISQ